MIVSSIFAANPMMNIPAVWSNIDDCARRRSFTLASR